MDDLDVLKARVSDLEESVRFFSSGNKAERELWVCESFLRTLGVTDPRPQLVRVQDDPPDVRYLGLNFEVKEILDSGRRRHSEYKLLLVKARGATTLGELSEHWDPKPKPLSEIATSVVDAATTESQRYAPSYRRYLDLIFYVNYLDYFAIPDIKSFESTALAALSWRSISLLFSNFAWILYAAHDAPDLLLENIGKPYYRNPTDSRNDR